MAWCVFVWCVCFGSASKENRGESLKNLVNWYQREGGKEEKTRDRQTRWGEKESTRWLDRTGLGRRTGEGFDFKRALSVSLVYLDESIDRLTTDDGQQQKCMSAEIVMLSVDGGAVSDGGGGGQVQTVDTIKF